MRRRIHYVHNHPEGAKAPRVLRCQIHICLHGDRIDKLV